MPLSSSVGFRLYSSDISYNRRSHLCISVSVVLIIVKTTIMAKTTIALASGKEMPLVGFGLWKVPIESTADTVFNVCDIDTCTYLYTPISVQK